MPFNYGDYIPGGTIGPNVTTPRTFGEDFTSRVVGLASDDSKDPIERLERQGSNLLEDARSDQTNDFTSSILRQARGADSERLAREAEGRSLAAFDTDRDAFSRDTRGLALTDRQRKGAAQSLGLNRAVTRAAAANRSRAASAEAARQAAQAGTQFSDITLEQQIKLSQNLANAEGQKRVREAQERANKKSNRNSLIGSLIGGILSFSAEEYKDKVEEAPRLLDKLKQVRVDKWAYKGSDIDHIGPYAEEFNKTFGVGDYKDAIDVVSLLGVTLGSIKELNEKVEAYGSR